MFSTISHIIQASDKNSISSIRNRIRSTYMGLAGSFEEKINVLVEVLSGNKKCDDFYKFNMRIVMIYFFEQCLYGIKSELEIKND